MTKNKAPCLAWSIVQLFGISEQLGQTERRIEVDHNNRGVIWQTKKLRVLFMRMV